MHTSIIDELPLILETTLSIIHLKRFNTHDEVINKFLGNWFESSISIIDPLVVEDLIFVGALYIIDIEYNLTEVDICYHYIPEESSIEHVGICADDFNVDIKLNG